MSNLDTKPSKILISDIMFDIIGRNILDSY